MPSRPKAMSCWTIMSVLCRSGQTERSILPFKDLIRRKLNSCKFCNRFFSEVPTFQAAGVFPSAESVTSNTAAPIQVKRTQWCIRTLDSIKCQKLHTGLGRLILTCYNDRLYSGIAKLVSRPVWEQGQAGLTPVTQISKTVCSIAEQTVFAIFSIFSFTFSFCSTDFIVTFYCHFFL